MAFVHLSAATRNAAANAVVDLIDAGAGDGTIKIYDGTAPATADTAVSTQNLITTHNFADPAFGDAAAGVVTAGTVDDGTAPGTGGPWTAAWARIADSNGDEVMDVDVGTSGTTLILNTVTITDGATISVTGGTFTMPSGT